MVFVSTRDSKQQVSAAQAVVKGLSNEDGGLFVPSSFPKISLKQIVQMLSMDYAERAGFIISRYFEEFTYAEMTELCRKAYSRFDEDGPAPLVKIDDGLFMLELWHGPTAAFKDLALSLLPHLMQACKQKLGITEQTMILAATSGDTGKAALEGFKDVEGVKIMALYPSEGVSPMQRLQMVTQEGDNVRVIGIDGNFDDAQNAVKEVFSDAQTNTALQKAGVALSSANSINFGRLAPQIAYYFSAYCDLLEAQEITIGDEVNFCVPTGNFGNILAAYYAKQMGLPIAKLICASNKNNILTDFLTTGTYDKNREFYKTISPSMDILISSNLERLLFEVAGRQDAVVRKWMQELKDNGVFSLSPAEMKQIGGLFYGGYADEEQTRETIENFFAVYGYLNDTHTAVAVAVLDDYFMAVDDDKPTVVVSTASPYKFVDDVLRSLQQSPGDTLAKSIKKLNRESAMPVPECLAGLEKKKVRFSVTINKADIKDAVVEFASEQ